MQDDASRKRVVVEEVTSDPIETPKAVDVAVVPPTPPVVETPVVPISPIIPTPEVKKTNPLVIIIPGVFLLGGLLGGIIFYQNKVSDTAPQMTDSPTISPTVTETTSTPASVEIDVTKYSINILNGSGIKGEALKVQELLEKAEFKISGTGNASNYDYTKTVIQAKEEVDKDFIAKLSVSLGEVYSVDTKVATLSATSKDSVVVIVGSTKK